jgi:hypothetical protein
MDFNLAETSGAADPSLESDLGLILAAIREVFACAERRNPFCHENVQPIADLC